MTTQQFHEQFDRIWELLPPNAKKTATSLATRGLIGWTVNTKDFTFYNPLEQETADDDYWQEFSDLFLFIKIMVLCGIFTARNPDGSYVLEQGGLENPKLKNLKDVEDLEISDGPEGRLAQMTFISLIRLTPPTLRGLFLANCAPENEGKADLTKIENLKLINW